MIFLECRYVSSYHFLFWISSLVRSVARPCPWLLCTCPGPVVQPPLAFEGDTLPPVSIPLSGTPSPWFLALPTPVYPSRPSKGITPLPYFPGLYPSPLPNRIRYSFHMVPIASTCISVVVTMAIEVPVIVLVVWD